MSVSSSPTDGGINLPNIQSNPLTQFLGAISPLGFLAADAGGIKNTLDPKTPDLQSPDALSSTPSQAQTNTTALQSELANESAVASTSTYLTGGAGLLDQPTTTSRVLMGS